ncbi:GntR family transcriptional regulator [Kitasatospora sp. NPDC001540]|uniref:GntR family transcriptional regulator n=1 Tax=Kitasatospora sp. NPDC001540 TaxID=3364014 RepID=UPI0036CEBAA7
MRAGAYDDQPWPSEAALAARFERASMTIRRALGVLRGGGLLTTAWGKGWKVLPRNKA